MAIHHTQRVVPVPALLFLAATATWAVGCSSSSENEDSATASMEVRIGRTTQINKLNYTLTGPHGFSTQGSIAVSQTRELRGSINLVAAGAPYTLNLNASSTDGNVTCTGSKSGITVTCPNSRGQNKAVVKLTCTRNRLGKEWGDRDWRSNARVFFLGAEISLVCALQDGGADTGASSDGGAIPDGAAEAESCAPKTCADAGMICGALNDGCGGFAFCGTCPSGRTCTPQGQCACLGVASCPAGTECGVAPDGCGGLLNCGICAAPNICSNGRCVCLPRTTCPPGQTAGTAPDGCGGTIVCGTCPPGIPPVDHCGIVSCGCLPRTVCSAGVNCGVEPDGCGCMLNCGTCASGSSCNMPPGGTSGTCLANPCDFRNGNTLACLQSRDKLGPPPQTPRCSHCVIDNGCLDPAQGGGACEGVTGTSPLACASVLGTAAAPSETQVCLAALQGIFESTCASTLQLAPCLCGTTDAAQCLDGSVPPNGPLVSVYGCDLGDIGGIVTNFNVPLSGAGQANVIVSCAAAFGCDCF